jgi:hypothetical protein
MSHTNEYCQNCGAAVTEPSAFCGSCGAALAVSPQPTAPSAAASSPAPAPAMRQTPAHPPAPTPGASSAAPTSPTPSPPPTSPSGTPPAGTTPPGTPPRAAPPGMPPGAPPSGTAQPADKQPPRSSRSWVPFAAVGGGAVLVAALVAILLLTVGGSAGNNLKSTSVTRQQALQLLADSGTRTVSSAAPGLFAFVSSGALTAIVPAGWRATAQAANGTTRAEFSDPKHPTSTLTIVAQGTGGGDPRKQAGEALRAVKKRGEQVSSYGQLTFPGGREAWQLTHLHAGLTDQTYFFSACSGKAAMVLDFAASTAVFQHEQTTLRAVADSAEPTCS